MLSSSASTTTVFILTCLASSSCKDFQYMPVGNYFPTCVDVENVYPYSHSVLKPIGKHEDFSVYAIQVTFSRTIASVVVPTFMLTPVLSADFGISYYNWRYLNERKVVVFFHVNLTSIGTPKVYFEVQAWSKELVPNFAERGITNRNREFCDYFHRWFPAKCYADNLTYSNLISVKAIIGEYYLDGKFNLSKFLIPPRQPTQGNHFCAIETKSFRTSGKNLVKTSHTSQQLMPNSTYHLGQVYLRVNNTSHEIYLDVSITLTGQMQRRRIIRLPKFIQATNAKDGFNFTVKLLNHLGIEILQEENPNEFNIPAEVRDVYELKEWTTHHDRVFENVPQLVKKKHDNANNISIVCPPNSMRNPSGHFNHHTQHIIKNGSLYHIIVPLLSESQRNRSLRAFHVNQSGSIVEEVKVTRVNNIGGRIKTALKKYVCLLPSTSELSFYNKTDSHRNTWIGLDKCIFVPYNIAFSSECGGLQLFKNKDIFRNDSNFCNYKFGACIGRPFSSTIRFPFVQTYGMQELTGWTVCPKCTKYAPNKEHPVGNLLYNGTRTRTFSRSLLKYQYNWWINMNSSVSKNVISATIVLSPYNKPKTGNLKLNIRLNDDLAVVYPKLEVAGSTGCSHVLLKLTTSPFSTYANLTVTVYNYEEGGGEVHFALKCVGLLKIYPLSGKLRKWIKARSNVSVTFQLNSKYAASQEKFVHHCNVTVKTARFHNPSIQTSCLKSIFTYYGNFQQPCWTRAKLVPMNLVYFILPPSDPSVSKVLQHMQISTLSQEYTFIKAISVTSQLHRGTAKQVTASRIYSAYIYCNTIYVVFLTESMLNSPTNQQVNSELFYHIDISSSKKIYFLSLKNKPEDVLTLCSLRLIANQPNGYCANTRITSEEIFISFSSADIHAVRKTQQYSYKGYNMELLKHLYGWQPFHMYCAMVACILTSSILCTCIATGYSIKHCFRARFTKNNIVLTYFKLGLKDAMDADEKFWAEPNSFLTHDSSYGAHFVLYNFKSLLPFNADELSGLKVAGVLRYKDKELPVVVGDINYIFIAKTPKTASIWLHATSGVYLLQLENCCPEYQHEFAHFLGEHGVMKKLLYS